MGMKKITLIAVSSTILLSFSMAWSCLHFPRTYRGKLTEGLQQVFLFRDGNNAHMVIRTNLHADKFPKEIAWVLPFPSLPSKYEEVDGPFFEELYRILPDDSSEGSFGGKGLRAGFDKVKRPSTIKVHEKVEVGSYQIQPIEILKDDSSKELSAWLTKNKFNPMPYKIQKPYLKKGATFLAIRMSMNQPGANDLKSKPLHIIYKSKNLSMPIKFTHETRTFDLDVFVFSTNELKKEFDAYYFKRQGSAAYENKGLYPFLDEVIGKKSGFISKYQADELNSANKKLAKLPDDPNFE